jgi:hypothetical protein
MKATLCWLALSIAAVVGAFWFLQIQAEATPAAAPTPRSQDKTQTTGKAYSMKIPVFELQLLKEKESHKEFKLSPEQIGKIETLIKTEEAALADIRNYSQTQEIRIPAAQKAVAAILDKDQNTRMDQLKLQATGPKIFFDGKVSEGLKLTGDQKSKLMTARAKLDTSMKEEAAKDTKATKATDFLKANSDYNRKVIEGLAKELTKEQSEKLTEMLGPIYQGLLPPYNIDAAMPEMPAVKDPAKKK